MGQTKTEPSQESTIEQGIHDFHEPDDATHLGRCCESEDWTVPGQKRIAARLERRDSVKLSSANVYWLEQSEADVPVHDDWLSANEAVLAAGLHFAKRRNDWRLGRWTAKCALSAYLNLPAEIYNFHEMEVRAAADGAPETWFAGHPAGVTISISHCAGIAICALASAGVYVGCDLEMVEPRSHAFTADYFADSEQAWVARASADERDRLVTLLWSAKESAMKALRAGLRLDTRSVTVDPFIPTFDLIRWKPLSVRYTDCRLPEDHARRGHYFGDHSFHGWWQEADKIVRTLVAAPAPGLPIRLGVAEHCLETPYKFSSKFE